MIIRILFFTDIDTDKLFLIKIEEQDILNYRSRSKIVIVKDYGLDSSKESVI